MKLNRILTAAILGFAGFSGQAADSSFSFNVSDAPVRYFGTGKKECYNVAVCLNEPLFSGLAVTGIKVEIPGEASIYGEVSAFMTKNLATERVDGKRVNVPDICSVPAKIENGWLSAKFDEPYLMTGDAVYVGYTFEIETLEKVAEMPVAVVSGHNPDGFWFHSSRTALKWTNYVEKETSGLQSAMTVLLEGDIPMTSATLNLPAKAVFATGEEIPKVAFEVVNTGAEEINSIECSWSLDNENGTTAYKFSKPVPAAIGAIGIAEITIPTFATPGKYPLSVEIKKINGERNANEASKGEGNVIFTPVKPVKLPLVEEYTGMWCGWCTRGYAALEWMKEEHGYDFVAAAWHNADGVDPLCVTFDYPNSGGGYPNAYYNRTFNLDPGYIPETWSSFCGGVTDYAITCTTEFSNEDKTMLKATAHVTPIEDGTTSPRIGYLLLADGLEDPDWKQSNYYFGISETEIAEMTGFPTKWVEFLASANPIMGLEYNDVVVNVDYSDGVKGSLPEKMEAFVTYDHEVTFDLTGIRSARGGGPITVIPEKVRVLAFILEDGNGVINACSSAYPGEPAPVVAVDSVEGDSAVMSTLWYDLEGHRLDSPIPGVNIKVEVLSDNKVRSLKVRY